MVIEWITIGLLWGTMGSSAIMSHMYSIYLQQVRERRGRRASLGPCRNSEGQWREGRFLPFVWGCDSRWTALHGEHVDSSFSCGEKATETQEGANGHGRRCSAVLSPQRERERERHRSKAGEMVELTVCKMQLFIEAEQKKKNLFFHPYTLTEPWLKWWKMWNTLYRYTVLQYYCVCVLYIYIYIYMCGCGLSSDRERAGVRLSVVMWLSVFM